MILREVKAATNHEEQGGFWCSLLSVKKSDVSRVLGAAPARHGRSRAVWKQPEIQLYQNRRRSAGKESPDIFAKAHFNSLGYPVSYQFPSLHPPNAPP